MLIMDSLSFYLTCTTFDSSIRTHNYQFHLFVLLFGGKFKDKGKVILVLKALCCEDMGGVEIMLHTFPTSTLDGDE
jgi:hypothetical protein